MSQQNCVYRYYDNCVYKDCMNGKRNGKRLYRFPLQTDERYCLWIRNSGKFFISYKFCLYNKTTFIFFLFCNIFKICI